MDFQHTASISTLAPLKDGVQNDGQQEAWEREFKLGPLGLT